MKIQITNNDWQTKQIKIKDMTMSVRYPWLPSESKMMRLAYKLGR